MTSFFLRRSTAVVTMGFLSLLCAGLLAGPACAAEKEEKKVVEKVKPDIWDVREEGSFFGIKRSTTGAGCTRTTLLALDDVMGSTFPDAVSFPDPTCLKVGGIDPTTDEGIPGNPSPRKSDPGTGSGLSTFSVTGRFP